MALSDYDKHLVFEVIDVPDADTLLYIDGAFLTARSSAGGLTELARAMIVARIDALSADLETRLSELLVAWKKVAVSNARLVPNAANQGVDYKPARQRALIRAAVLKIVPVVLSGGDTECGELPLA